MKRQLFFALMFMLVALSCSNRTDDASKLEQKARERIESATAYQMKDYIGNLPFEISDVVVSITNDSLCVLLYNAKFNQSRLGRRNWMEYYIIRVKEGNSGRYEYYDQAYPIDGDIKLYDSLYWSNRLSEVYKAENGNYASETYYDQGMYEAAIIRTFKKPLYSGARRIE